MAEAEAGAPAEAGEAVAAAVREGEEVQAAGAALRAEAASSQVLGLSASATRSSTPSSARPLVGESRSPPARS